MKPWGLVVLGLLVIGAGIVSLWPDAETEVVADPSTSSAVTSTTDGGGVDRSTTTSASSSSTSTTEVGGATSTTATTEAASTTTTEASGNTTTTTTTATTTTTTATTTTATTSTTTVAGECTPAGTIESDDGEGPTLSNIMIDCGEKTEWCAGDPLQNATVIVSAEVEDPDGLNLVFVSWLVDLADGFVDLEQIGSAWEIELFFESGTITDLVVAQEIEILVIAEDSLGNLTFYEHLGPVLNPQECS